MKNMEKLEKLRGKLIVSCQALPSEPLYSAEDPIMGRMAYAAAEGGAGGIRANTVVDILDIRRHVDLPIIGIIKREFPGEKVFITPTMEEIDALAAIGCDVIAADATCRRRPDGRMLDAFFAECRRKYPDQLFMADCSTYEEGMTAAELGFDVVSTTLAGYTEYTKGTPLPDLDMARRLVRDSGCRVIVEGGIWSPDQLAAAFEAGAFAAVVGTAITRPRDITRRFVAALPRKEDRA